MPIQVQADDGSIQTFPDETSPDAVHLAMQAYNDPDTWGWLGGKVANAVGQTSRAPDPEEPSPDDIAGAQANINQPYYSALMAIAQPSLAAVSTAPGGAAATGQSTQPAQGNIFAASPQSIDEYLKAKGSPMAGQGQMFYDLGAANHLDPRFLVAISGAETGFGKNVTWGANNAFNIGTNTKDRSHSPQASWGEAARQTAENFNRYRYSGMNTVDDIYHQYCDFGKYRDSCASGLNNVKIFMREQGADNDKPRWPALPVLWK